MTKFNSWTQRLLAGFSLAVLLAGSATAWLLLIERDARRWVSHTAEVREELADYRITALRSEVARRGYLLSGNGQDLAGYQDAARQLQGKLQAVQHLTADNPQQQSRLAELQGLATARSDHALRAIALRRAGHIAEAVGQFSSTSDNQQTKRIAQLITATMAEEVRLDGERRNRAAQLETSILSLLAVIACILSIGGVVAARDRRHRLKALESANAQLASDNARRHAVERELALLAENATDAVFRLGLDGRFIYASPSVLDIIGLPPGKLVGKSLFASLHPDDEVSVFTALHRLRCGEVENLTLTYRVALPRSPSEWTWLEASTAVIRDEGGMALEVIASIRDISRRKQLEFDLREARREAEDAAAAKANFLANMSHEIRTPMNGVVGFADLLLATELGTDQRRYVQLIADSGAAMTHLLNDILDFSKVEAGQMTIADKVFDLPATLNACARLIEPTLMKKGVRLHCEIAEDLPLSARGDALRLRQILLNLLGNAAKFTDRGMVTLRARSDDAGHRIVVEVEDSGVGIPPDRHAAIFNPFVQADTDTAEGYGGTGLGLPISLQLTRLMGGTLELVSEVSRGTKVTLNLPLVAAANPYPSETSHLPEPRLGGESRRDLRVLVAEDHDVNQLLITAMLNQLGCRVDIAPDGAKAIALALAARPDDPYAIMLMDQRMPVMTGSEAARNIRQAGIGPEVLPIVALTANAYADDIAACLEAGMQGHLTKPINLADLAAALERWARTPTGYSQSKAISPQKPDVRSRYGARKAETLERLEAAAQMPTVGEEMFVELSDLLHKLAGTAGLFGEAALGERARALEESWRICPSSERSAELLRALPELRQAA